MAGWPNLHWLGGDIHVGQLAELLVHGRQSLFDVLRRAPAGDVQEHATVLGAAAGFDFGVDGAGDLIAWEQVRSSAVLLVLVPGVGLSFSLRRLSPEKLWNVLEHEAVAGRILQRSTVTAH